MLLRSMPDLSCGNAEFRRWFLSKWGKENCIVLGRSRRADFGPCTHTLSIRAAWGGAQRCLLSTRCVDVDDDSFLVLNHGRVYSTSIRAPWPVESLAICFRQGLAEQAAAAMAMPLAQALEHDDTLAGEPPEFMESLQPHDRLVSPVLRFIRAHLLLGLDDEAWYEEQLLFLLERMLAHRIRAFALADELQMLRRARSREVFRRIGVATDFLNTNYTQTLVLADVARVACLSKHHFLRLFTRLHGITPLTYLQRKRAIVALRLLQKRQMAACEVAASVGFADRGTLLRQVRRWTGLSPSQVRKPVTVR